MKPTLQAILCPAMILVGSACGRDLELSERQDLTSEEIVQAYEINIFATESGVTNYVAKAAFKTKAEYNSKSLKLPEGDTISLNNVPLTWSESDNDYRATGTEVPETFDFRWTHEGESYGNSLEPFNNPPSQVPSAISKTEGFTVPISGLSEGVKVFANLNQGSEVAAPFFALPTDADDSEEAVETDLSSLVPGAGVLTVIETKEESLEDSTSGGGSRIVKVQFGYNVTIEE